MTMQMKTMTMALLNHLTHLENIQKLICNTFYHVMNSNHVLVKSANGQTGQTVIGHVITGSEFELEDVLTKMEMN